MRICEIIVEDVSSQASLKNIVDSLTTEIPSLYRRISMMAEKFAKTYTPKRENGVYKEYDPRDFYRSASFLTNSQKGSWYKDSFFKTMKPALNNFSKSLPGNLRKELDSLLSDMTINGSFNVIEGEMFPLLGKIANLTKNDKLKSAVDTAMRARDAYNASLDRAETIAADVNSDINSGYSDNSPKDKDKSSIGSQNAAVDAIINDVLNRVDKKVAGEIRNAIAKSGNKLMALQHELKRRDINPK